MNVGYTQSRKTIECPDCPCRYRVLMDAVICPADSERMQEMERLAFEYFSNQVKAEHEGGHPRYQLSMRDADFRLSRAV